MRVGRRPHQAAAFYTPRVSKNAPKPSVHEGTSEEDIVNEMWRMSDQQGLNAVMMAFQAEMTRKNNVALRAFKASSDRWQLVLAILSLVLIGVGIETAYLAWVLIERAPK